MKPVAADLDSAAVAHLADIEEARLQALGVTAGDSIGWLACNHPRTLGLLQACRRLGARWVPLNWRLAAAELAHIVEHAGLQHLLHDQANAALAAEVMQRVALPQPQAPGHQPGDLMLVYTSGTTGQPKGAIHTAAGMDANLTAAIACQDLGPETRCLAVLPMFHVGGLCIQVLPTLAAGGTVRLHERFDPAAWLRDVAAWRPTTSLLVPAAMRAIVEHPDWRRTDLSSLRFVNSGSQVVPLTLIEAFHSRGVPVTQVYGSTETGPVSIVLRPEEAMANAGRVGRPALGVQVSLADDGEILLKAPNLLRAYHRSTVQAFDDAGWFHTGDLARLHPDGLYEVTGRSKELIISGGENIHPAEIENLAALWPGVAAVAVVGLPDERWGEVPVLALVAQAGADPDLAGLRAFLGARLARFKQPGRIVLLPSLPQTALGKVQRERLVGLLGGTVD